MKQAIITKGKVLGQEIPTPAIDKGKVLIQVHYSCISAGTEMTSVNNTKKSLLQRALDQPQEVKTVIEFAKKNGLSKTIQKVKGVIDGGKPTGYSIAGKVIETGEGVSSFQVGDFVAAAGAGIANHAEVVAVPENLVMHSPKGLDLQLASTVTLGGIAMQGVRRAALSMGETCVVVGAGILGLIALQLLRVSGVRVIVTDLDEDRLALAKQLGAERCINRAKDDVFKTSNHFSGGNGVDAVLFTAATSSSDPLSQSFKMCKKKGKVVLVGVSGMEINRKDIYAKELDFLISTSYGPGRYDDNYEQKGLDYPFSYVRWTENRNMTEYLRLLHEGQVELQPMIHGIFPISDVEQAYEQLSSANPKPIILLLEYPKEIKHTDQDNVLQLKSTTVDKSIVSIGLIGAGSFATGMHLPNLKTMKDKYHLRAVLSRDGFKAKKVGEQFGADYVTTEVDEILKDSEIDLVLIATRHDSHGSLVLRSLRAGKHTFVEKPLCVSAEELRDIKAFYSEDTQHSKPVLMTGFNRRFSPYLQEIRKHTSARINPLMIQYRMNAGYIPKEHWVHESGGRIVGECCHIIDTVTSLTQSKIQSIGIEKISPNNDKFSPSDNVSILLKYEDGSIGNIQYFSLGSKSLAKEAMEVHFDEQSIVMEDYKSLKGYGVTVKNLNHSSPEKGQKEELERLYDTLQGKSNQWPIELWDMLQTTEATFLISQS